MLTVNQKPTRVTISKQCLDKFEHVSSEFLQCNITVDGMFTHYYTPVMEIQSKQCTVGQKGNETPLFISMQIIEQK